LEDATGEIRKAGGAAHTIALDLRAPSAAGRLAEFTMSRCGRIDVLVNNAGATKRASFWS